ncbi:glucosaminidase domain-containing protein [Persicobacter sp. CCB-QB2]|uniref:glucosaminidase domain-containing protein n=1 Tax=Persicobacter sp. CCB-QB2 TaxID=1561025 RepID=UPI0006A98E9A|nr:glucosaminidase domain-containing protein [Persicobacter sp. CCB-QB2]
MKRLKTLGFLLLLGPFGNSCSTHVNLTEGHDDNEETEFSANYVFMEQTDDILPVDGPGVAPVIYQNLKSLGNLPVHEKTAKFIDMMLPTIILARERKLAEKERVEMMINNRQYDPSTKALLSLYLAKYKAKSVEELPLRMTPPPISMILAQSVMETGWGTSSIFLEANNAFGVWSFSANEPRRATKGTRNNRPVYVRAYDDILSSTEHYLDIIGRVYAYEDLRNAMQVESNSLELVNHLTAYSEEGSNYISLLKSIIRKYKMQQYDAYYSVPQKEVLMAAS